MPRTIICFANSRKHSGRCVAGKDVRSREWIRPVSARPSAELSRRDRSFENGTDIGLLDIVKIPVEVRQPHDFQTENFLNDENAYWVFQGRASWDDAKANLDVVASELWSNGASTFNGLNDYVAETAAPSFGYSLVLIEVVDLTIIVAAEGVKFGDPKRKLRGQFTNNSFKYKLMITDPELETRFLASQDGTFPVGQAILCVSLGEPFQGHAYKLIAGVILPP